MIDLLKNKKAIFMPDATYGVINSISYQDLEKLGIDTIVTNTLHMYLNAGDEYINSIGGFKQFTGFRGNVITDSAGFQAYSLVTKGLGKVLEDGVLFVSPKNGSRHMLTPEKSIEIQFNLGSNVLICLDDSVKAEESDKRIEDSVEKTTLWAKRCKKRYEQLVREKGYTQENKPLLFCVIQGGRSKDLRKQSFMELAEIGFDGFGLGGWLQNKDGTLNLEITSFVSNLVKSYFDNQKYIYAMGVGTPDDITNAKKYGYNLFDCVLPTRNARHALLYTHKGKGETKGENYDIIKITTSKYKADISPIKEDSEFEELRNTSKAFLRHLFQIGDSNAYRLATLNNLEFYRQITDV